MPPAGAAHAVQLRDGDQIGVPAGFRLLYYEGRMTDNTLSLETRVVATRDQVSANVSGESVILGMRDGVYFGIDTVGTRIWELMQRPVVLADIAAQIEREFDVTRERANADLLAFAASLVARGLIERVAD